jgi:hypothetical protein
VTFKDSALSAMSLRYLEVSREQQSAMANARSGSTSDGVMWSEVWKSRPPQRDNKEMADSISPMLTR